MCHYFFLNVFYFFLIFIFSFLFLSFFLLFYLPLYPSFPVFPTFLFFPTSSFHREFNPCCCLALFLSLHPFSYSTPFRLRKLKFISGRRGPGAAVNEETTSSCTSNDRHLISSDMILRKEGRWSISHDRRSQAMPSSKRWSRAIFETGAVTRVPSRMQSSPALFQSSPKPPS